MRNAQWFREQQEDLIRKENAKQMHIFAVNKQWDRVVDIIEHFKLESEDKYIKINEILFNENIDKLENEFGFYVCNNYNHSKISRIYFRKEDYDKLKWINGSQKDDSIYNLKDGKHENSTKDDVFNRGLSRQKAKDDIRNMMDKSKKSTIDLDEIPMIKIEYNNKNGKTECKVNDKIVSDFSSALNEAIRSFRYR